MPATSLRTCLLTLLLLCVVVTDVAAQQPAAEAAALSSPAVERITELARIIGSGDLKAVREFVQRTYAPTFLNRAPLDAHVNFILQMQDRSRGLEVERVEEATSAGATALVRAKITGRRMRLIVEVEPAAPHRIAGIATRPAPAVAPTRRLSEQEVVSELDAFVKKMAEADLFSGAVLLAKDGRPLYNKAYGKANKDFDVPNRVDTKFNLGSMNKMFTAVAIAQLVERGKLSYEDPLSKFLPDFPTAEEAAKIKIKHLLTHTSGLGSYFNEEFQKSSRARFRSVSDMMGLAKGERLAFEPGSRWSYSNTGMLVLGAIIEKVTGQDYFEYIRENIYRPAGMTSTDAYELDRVNPNLAVGYDKQFGEGGVYFRNNVFAHVIRGGPAGGGYSTVEDLLRFDAALRSGKLLNAESRKTLFSARPELNSPNYGYGFMILDGGSIVGHSGGFLGISSNLDMHLSNGYTAVVMSNYSGGSQPVVEMIRGLLAAVEK
ncbi:MAG TPA: serine hydrolase domain-containing protein [Pyrinomonadaceae bacterium]|nr:serine hydrolase domain-containing protein [Pyrinomonadaceae bacterium]